MVGRRFALEQQHGRHHTMTTSREDGWIRILATDFTLPGKLADRPKEAALVWLGSDREWLDAMQRLEARVARGLDEPVVRTGKREKLLSLMMARRDRELSPRERWDIWSLGPVLN